jgi:hypothetical protein
MNIDLNKIDLPTYNVIPDGTIASCRIVLKRGGYTNDIYTDGWATKSKSSEAVFLVASFELLDGKFKHRLVNTNIGLFSEKSDVYAKIGLETMRSIIDSAYDIKAEIDDPRRSIRDYGDLDGLVCICKIKVKMQEYKGELQPKNEVQVLLPSSKEYKIFKLENQESEIKTKISSAIIDDEIPFDL